MVLNVKTKSKQICDEIAFPFFSEKCDLSCEKIHYGYWFAQLKTACLLIAICLPSIHFVINRTPFVRIGSSVQKNLQPFKLTVRCCFPFERSIQTVEVIRLQKNLHPFKQLKAICLKKMVIHLNSSLRLSVNQNSHLFKWLRLPFKKNSQPLKCSAEITVSVRKNMQLLEQLMFVHYMYSTRKIQGLFKDFPGLFSTIISNQVKCLC